LCRSLLSLSADLESRGSRLILRRGPSGTELCRLAAETGARTVVWNRRYEPASIARDRAVESALGLAGVRAETYLGSLLFDPETMRNRSGRPFRVFTPFWRACLAARAAEAAADAPSRLAAPVRWPGSLDVSQLDLEPKVDWAAGLREAWQPGESGAHRRLARFVETALSGYERSRDLPGVDGVSRLSPHLHFGEISPGQAWRTVSAMMAECPAAAEAFLRQLAWREFAYHVLVHQPESPVRPLRPEFEAFPWRSDPAALKAWQRGKTGYPLVDAGMRELWRTGWMHNRVRMVAASFLVKHLLIPWQEGARWFWDTLVDADLANNSFGWQWVAGCGADAAPYFRIFNPAVQARKFDAEGRYVGRWVPELRAGGTYPPPMVEHEFARARALEALASMRCG
jgi:deoxyribodipyrimidine photo-lyase